MQVHVDSHVAQIPDIIHSVTEFRYMLRVGTEGVIGSCVLLFQQQSLCGTCTVSMLCRVHTAEIIIVSMCVMQTMMAQASWLR